MTTATETEPCILGLRNKAERERREQRLIELMTRMPGIHWDDEDIAMLQVECIRVHLEVNGLRKKNIERRKALRTLNRAMAASKWQLDCMRQNYLKVANALARVEARNRD